MLHGLIDWIHGLTVFWFQLLESWGYFGVIFLMALESSIVPVPSEVVIPPAAYWASQGKMSFWGVVISGTVGSWIGSAISYWVALWVGRAFILKFGKWVHITPDKVERAERFVHRYEAGGIFFARLLPVIRHLISIPAGIIKMNFLTFSIMTTIGSFTWCYILAKFSMYVFSKYPDKDPIADPRAMVEMLKHESYPIIGGILALCALYVLAMKLTASKATPAPAAEA
ncbi:MAG TPA: DedA family protein [Chthoniobacteraceae bacterium]|nr:DedA family protein [Chthoniobacteraceae bacterium]